MSQLTQRAIRVYAVLDAYSSSGGDILDTILPFFEPFLAEINDQLLDPSAFCSAVRHAYGWNITPDVIEELAPRLQRQGWLTSIGSGNSQAFRVTYKPKDNGALGEAEVEIARAISQLSDGFKDFIAKISPLTGYSKTKDELAETPIEWLISIDGFTEDVLKTQAVKVTEVGRRLTIEVREPKSGRLNSEDRYLCARFVKHLFDVQSPFTKQLARIASIGLLTEVVQDFSKPTSAVNKTDLSVYLDAPVALDCLGVSGKAAQANIRGLTESLTQIGASIRVFRTSIDEMQRALQALIKRKPADRIGPTADALRRNEVLEAYVRAVCADPEHFLKERGIQVVDRTLEQFPNSHHFFSHAKYEELYSKFNWHYEDLPRAHDASIIALVMRLRGGQSSKDIFLSRHVLVTRNALLSDRARRFCVESGLSSKTGVGPAVHQRQLATAAWLRTGLGQQSEVPRRYLLAACEKVLALKKGVVEQARAVATSLTPETSEQLELLLRQDRSAQLLMDRTLGISTVITSGNIETLVADMKQELIALNTEETGKIIALEREKSAAVRLQGEQSLSDFKAREERLRGKISAQEKEKRRVIDQAVIEANRSNWVPQASGFNRCCSRDLAGGLSSPSSGRAHRISEMDRSHGQRNRGRMVCLLPDLGPSHGIKETDR